MILIALFVDLCEWRWICFRTVTQSEQACARRRSPTKGATARQRCSRLWLWMNPALKAICTVVQFSVTSQCILKCNLYYFAAVLQSDEP